jgi:hypothetical protein
MKSERPRFSRGYREAGGHHGLGVCATAIAVTFLVDIDRTRQFDTAARSHRVRVLDGTHSGLHRW